MDLDRYGWACVLSQACLVKVVERLHDLEDDDEDTHDAADVKTGRWYRSFVSELKVMMSL